MNFPSIEQFRHVILNVRLRAQYAGKDEDGEPQYDESISPPTLRVQGSVKLHGTNAAVRLRDGVVVPMSRNRVVSVEDDNYGFAAFVASNDAVLRGLLAQAGPDSTLYGEWCGRGIARGCAIHQLEPMFVIFALRTAQATTRSGPTWPTGYTFAVPKHAYTTSMSSASTCWTSTSRSRRQLRHG